MLGQYPMDMIREGMKIVVTESVHKGGTLLFKELILVLKVPELILSKKPGIFTS